MVEYSKIYRVIGAGVGLVISAILLACQQLSAGDASKPDTPLEIVLHVNQQIWNERDLSVLDTYIAEDMDYTTPYSTTKGREGILLDAKQYYDWAESNTSTFKAYAENEEDVFLRWESESKPSGETAFYNNKGIDYYKVVEGKIVAWKTAHEIDSTASNKKIVEAIVSELWNQRDLSAVDRYFSPEVEVTYEGETTIGNENVAAGAEFYFAGWTNTKTTITHLVAEGDGVTIRWQTTGTQTGPYGDLEATGKTITYTGADYYRFSEGKVIETWTFWDRAKVFETLTAE
ncbi:MAG: nuclear transport factor 2 family protein [Verrucomicrobiota bacterium]